MNSILPHRESEKGKSKGEGRRKGTKGDEERGRAKRGTKREGEGREET